MKRYLVTGGCGFIGSHLCDALRHDGHQVRVLDDLSTGTWGNLATGAELLVGDVADPAVMARAVQGIDGVFHLAAIASVQRAADDWLGTHRANLTGAITVFDAIRALPGTTRGTPKPPVVYASSAAVYGGIAPPPLAEDARCEPLSAYGADKYGSELHARVAAHVHGIASAGMRFFNVYGPRQDPASPYSGAISIFCDRITRGQPVTVFGDGMQTRDFVFVSDVVVALRAAMQWLDTEAPPVSPPVSRVFNICTGTPITVRDVATTIATLCRVTPNLDFQPARAGEIRHSHGVPAQARATLGFAAQINLAEGLRQVLAWLPASRG